MTDVQYDWAGNYGDPASIAHAHFQQMVGAQLAANDGAATFGCQTGEFETLTEPRAVFDALDWTVVDEWKFGHGSAVLARTDERHFALLTLDRGSRSLYAKVAAADIASAGAFLDLVAENTTPVEAAEGDLSVRFWSHHPMQGAVSYTREIATPAWADAQTNYPSEIRPLLDALANMDGPPDSGRLMLLHGPPGSGKTSMLRMLGQEWADWADVEYVIDPDMFFDSANYMTSVMLGEWGDDRWRLIIVEDADELIAADSHARSGQGAARLLNLADGMLGQGLRVLVCVTTNEPVESLHAAVVRPGRCFANIYVGHLSEVDANDWRAEHDLDAGEGDATLAELWGEVHAKDAPALLASSVVENELVEGLPLLPQQWDPTRSAGQISPRLPYTALAGDVWASPNITLTHGGGNLNESTVRGLTPR